MGVLIIIKLANYIAEHLPILQMILKKTGQSTIIILMNHTLIREIIEKGASSLLGGGITFLLISMNIQVLLGIIIKLFLVKIGEYRKYVTKT